MNNVLAPTHHPVICWFVSFKLTINLGVDASYVNVVKSIGGIAVVENVVTCTYESPCKLENV